MLAFVIFGDQSCEQIHVELERGTQRQEGDGDTVTFRRNQRERLYFNRLFATGEKGGRLFEELSELDPACIDNPRFDRIVAAIQRSRSGSESLFVAANGRLNHVALSLESGSHAGDVGEQISHAELRRRAFFEGREEEGDSTAREGTWLEMTPFRSIRKWVENLQTFRQGHTELPSQLSRLICRAISLTDNVPEHLLDRYLAVRTASSQKTELVVVRLFESSAFRLLWEKVDTRATVMGELPTAMLLQYGERGDPTLEISADLFELLMRFAEGYRLGSEELEGVAAHLQLFKNRLLAMPAREVYLLHPALGQFVAKQELVAATRRISLEVAE